MPDPEQERVEEIEDLLDTIDVGLGLNPYPDDGGAIGDAWEALSKLRERVSRLQRAEEALRRGREIAEAIPKEGQITVSAHRVRLLLGEAFFQGVEARVARQDGEAAEETRDTHQIQCTQCSASEVLYADEPTLDLSAMEPGWRFDTEAGWRCPDHAQAKGERDED